MPDSHSDKPVQQTGAMGCVLRMVWMLAGNGVLLYGAIWIIQNSGKTLFAVADVIFGAALFAVIFTRYLDIKCFNGAKGTGEPATMSDWKRFAILMIAIAALGWVAAHGIAFVLAK